MLRVVLIILVVVLTSSGAWAQETHQASTSKEASSSTSGLLDSAAKFLDYVDCYGACVVGDFMATAEEEAPPVECDEECKEAVYGHDPE